MTYEELLVEADALGLKTKELPLEADDGLIYKKTHSYPQKYPYHKGKSLCPSGRTWTLSYYGREYN